MTDHTDNPHAMSPHSRAMLLNVLWHHQGGSSAVGQPIRKILGMGEHDRLTDAQIAEAKWIDGLLSRASQSQMHHAIMGVSRYKGGVYFAETEDLASAAFIAQGGNKETNRIYARRIIACVSYCQGLRTEFLESGPAAVVGKIKSVTQQRDKLLVALKLAVDGRCLSDAHDLITEVERGA